MPFPLFAAVESEVIALIGTFLGGSGILGGAAYMVKRWIQQAEKERDEALEELKKCKDGAEQRQLRTELAASRDECDRYYREMRSLRDKYDNDIFQKELIIKQLKENLEQITHGTAARQVAVAALEEVKAQEQLQEVETKEDEQETAITQNGQPRVWIIAPCGAEDPDQFKEVMRFNFEHNVISIGWQGLGDISSYDEDKLRKEIEHTYPDGSPHALGAYFSVLWKFYKNIKVGDIVIARQGTKRIAAVGTVQRTAYYRPNWSPAREDDGKQYPNHIDVAWTPAPRDKGFPKAVFGLLTVTKLPESRLRELVPEIAAKSASFEKTTE